jgi:hypothetical protein
MSFPRGEFLRYFCFTELISLKSHTRARARVSRCIRFIGSFLALTNHVSLMCILSDVKRTDIKTRASIDALADSRIARSQSTNTRSSPTSRRLKVARR